MSKPLTPTERKRLLKVAQSLRETKHAEVFSMDVFGFSVGPDDEHADDEHACGTPACALGNYAVRRDLQRTFRLGNRGQLVMNSGDAPPQPADWTKGIFFAEGPIAKHFGLDDDEMEQVFGTDGCRGAKTPLAAAKFIEKFARNHR